MTGLMAYKDEVTYRNRRDVSGDTLERGSALVERNLGRLALREILVDQ